MRLLEPPADNAEGLQPGEIAIAVTRDDLLLINNALNEVGNGIDIEDWEFATRLGVERDEALALLKVVSTILNSKERPKK